VDGHTHGEALACNTALKPRILDLIRGWSTSAYTLQLYDNFPNCFVQIGGDKLYVLESPVKSVVFRVIMFYNRYRNYDE
jgi:hypothetical protein